MRQQRITPPFIILHVLQCGPVDNRSMSVELCTMDKSWQLLQSDPSARKICEIHVLVSPFSVALFQPWTMSMLFASARIISASGTGDSLFTHLLTV